MATYKGRHVDVIGFPPVSTQLEVQDQDEKRTSADLHEFTLTEDEKHHLQEMDRKALEAKNKLYRVEKKHTTTVPATLPETKSAVPVRTVPTNPALKRV